MRNGTETLIRLVGVSRVYTGADVETHALSNVDLQVSRGEYLCVSGPSGCGKTTLLSILGLLDTPTRGEYYVSDTSVTGLSATERARLRNTMTGFVFQAFNLIGDLTISENVELPLRYRRLSGAERRKRVHKVLEQVGMAHRASHYPAQLSGGQQQRAAVARALVGDPTILLADEPTGNLDSQNGESIMALLRLLHADGTTVCMVTHNPDYARYADRTIHLFDGRIVGDVEA